jgi:hypothetical protein
MLAAVSINQMLLSGKMSASIAAYSKNNGENVMPPENIKITGVDGRILIAGQIDDTADWLEIAQTDNGGYSLIIRQKFININPSNISGAIWQYTKFGTDNKYSSSLVRKAINAWFQSTAEGFADKLPADAKLRYYTVENNALSEVGSGTLGTAGLEGGFSKPDAEPDRTGYDVAFALSFGEAANFISKEYDSWGNMGIHESNLEAKANFAKIDIPAGDNAYNRLWLRSPGNSSNSACELDSYGKVFQIAVDGTNGEYGLIYPALWVNSGIFAEAVDYKK